MTLASAIAATILAIQPMAPATARSYARIVVAESHKVGTDPWLEVAIVKNESHWISSVVSPDGRCIGFGQICLSCDPSEAACSARKASLLDPATNLRVIAQMLSSARRYCKKRTGHAREHHYLAVYQGADARRHTTCGQVRRRGVWGDAPMHPLTRRVLRSRDEMQSASSSRGAQGFRMKDEENSGCCHAYPVDPQGGAGVVWAECPSHRSPQRLPSRLYFHRRRWPLFGILRASPWPSGDAS